MADRPKVILICSTPRSGSTFLCDLLRQTENVGFGKEVLEWAVVMKRDIFPYIPYKTEEEVLADFPGYINSVIENFGAGKSHIAFKVHYNQLERWRRLDIRPLDVIDPDHYIFIKRRDMVMQTVSLHIANQTKSYNSNEKIEDAVEYKGDDITLIEYFLRRMNIRWEYFFFTNGIKPLRIIYEDLNDDPKKIINHILIAFEIQPLQSLEEINSTLKIQRNQLNEEWAKKYRKHRISWNSLSLITNRLLKKFIT